MDRERRNGSRAAMSRRKFLTLMDAVFDRLDRDDVMVPDDFHLPRFEIAAEPLSFCVKNLRRRPHNAEVPQHF